MRWKPQDTHTHTHIEQVSRGGAGVGGASKRAISAKRCTFSNKKGAEREREGKGGRGRERERERERIRKKKGDKKGGGGKGGEREEGKERGGEKERRERGGGGGGSSRADRPPSSLHIPFFSFPLPAVPSPCLARPRRSS